MPPLNRSPLVVLGIDAGDPEFLAGWMREGHLPTLSGIAARGVHARTGGAELISEHGAWVSVFSGISRRDHGYFYFRQMKPGTYDLETVTGLDLDAPPFWTRLPSDGRRFAIVDIPDTDPVPGLPGVQLAHWATHNNWDPDHFRTAAEPPDVLEEIRGRFGARFVTREKHDSSVDEDLEILDALLARVGAKGAACRALLDRGPFDLFATVFAESHTANHQFWRYRPEIDAAPPSAPPRLRRAIRDVYSAIDRELGLLIERLPADANVVVASSVGMEDDFPATGLIEAFCRGFGYQAAPASRRRPRGPMDVARRVLPERIRVVLSRRLSREAREQLLAEQFRSATDWDRTRVFALPSAYTSFVRVNLRGREPRGTVEPAEYDAVLAAVERDLATLVDPESGEPAVVATTRTTEAFGCGPHATLPDLWVDWRPGRFLGRVVHPGGELVQERPDFYRRSDHGRHGFFAAAGPGIPPRGEIGDVDVLDVAPTLLAMLGEPPFPDMRGRALPILTAPPGTIRSDPAPGSAG